MGDPRHALGRQAERRVASWLSASGWRILAQRNRSGGAEIDVVALDPDRILVAVEVRLRRSGRSGEAVESVRPEKVLRLRTALTAYARVTPIAHHGLRVDLVAVSPGPEPRTWRLRRLPGVDAW
ncbi:MAG: YraN family protein [Chloroflexi bacterium]|nr:MAG: YraN family protein [Chloroflexota bacterium]